MGHRRLCVQILSFCYQTSGQEDHGQKIEEDDDANDNDGQFMIA